MASRTSTSQEAFVLPEKRFSQSLRTGGALEGRPRVMTSRSAAVVSLPAVKSRLFWRRLLEVACGVRAMLPGVILCIRKRHPHFFCTVIRIIALTHRDRNRSKQRQRRNPLGKSSWAASDRFLIGGLRFERLCPHGVGIAPYLLLNPSETARHRRTKGQV